MKTNYRQQLEKLKEKHAKQMLAAEMEADIADVLAPIGLEPSSMYVHSDEVAVTLEKEGYFSEYSADEVLELLDLWGTFEFVPMQLRKDSCIMHVPQFRADKECIEKTELVCNYLHYFEFSEGWEYDRRGQKSTTFSNESLNFHVMIPAGKWAESSQAHGHVTKWPEGTRQGSYLLLDVQIRGAGSLHKVLDNQAGVSGDTYYPTHRQLLGTGKNSSTMRIYWEGTNYTV